MSPDDSLITTGKVRVIADEPVPAPTVKKSPWWKRLWKAMFG